MTTIKKDRLNKSNELKEVRKDILDFAKKEIRPFIDMSKIKTKGSFKSISDRYKRMTTIADEQAFDLALKVFLMYDNRLRGALTLAEIGIILGQTRARVQQVENNAMRKLGHPSYVKILKQYLQINNGIVSTDF